MAISPKAHAATQMLARMLMGVSQTARSQGDEPDFGMDEIVEDDGRVSAKLVLPSGDTYRIAVEWDSEESP